MDKREYILKYIEEHGIIDKDYVNRSDKSGIIKRGTGKKRKKEKTKELDLHGKNSSEAEVLIQRLLENCKKKGIKKARIIHGRGYHSSPDEGPVLKKTTHALLENRFSPLIKDFLPAPQNQGGEGATIVYIK